METVIVSDINGEVGLVSDVSGDALILLGDNISKNVYTKRSINALKEETRRVAKECKEYFDHVAWLSGNADLKPDLIEEILVKEEVLPLTESRSSNIFYHVGGHELKQPVLSFGAGATIGGITQLLHEQKLLDRGELPQSQITVHSEINPFYSGSLFYTNSLELLGEVDEYVLINHNPPYMGEGIKGLETRCEGGLDYILSSNVRGASGFKHVGCVYLRKLVEEKPPSRVYCGHVEERGGERGSIGETRVFNVAEHPLVIDL